MHIGYYFAAYNDEYGVYHISHDTAEVLTEVAGNAALALVMQAHVGTQEPGKKADVAQWGIGEMAE